MTILCRTSHPNPTLSTPPYPTPNSLLQPLDRLDSGLVPFATANMLPTCPTTRRHLSRRVVTLNRAEPKIEDIFEQPHVPDLIIGPTHTHAGTSPLAVALLSARECVEPKSYRAALDNA
jgi:hypothetical protein